MSATYSLPSKVGVCLKRIDLEYKRSKKETYRTIIASARVAVVENTDSTDWDGGATGHDLILFLPESILHDIALGEQNEIGNVICSDLNSAHSVFREYFNKVRLELSDETDPMYLGALPASQSPPASADLLNFWKPGLIRLFISHRDAHKAKANELATSLESYGISSFVAHDTIQPTKEWRREIISGLETMEIMLLFLTDDFHESPFTSQEIGFALGRSVPIISLKLERKDPPGFVGHEQALRGNLATPSASTSAVYSLLIEKLGRRERAWSSLISAFVTATDFVEAKHRFDRMDTAVQSLSDSQLSTIISGYYKNDQLYRAGHLTSKYERLRRFLERATGRQFTINGRKIQEIDMATEKVGADEIPF